MRKVRIVLISYVTMEFNKLMRYPDQVRLLEDMIRPKTLCGCGPKSFVG